MKTEGLDISYQGVTSHVSFFIRKISVLLHKKVKLLDSLWLQDHFISKNRPVQCPQNIDFLCICSAENDPTSSCVRFWFLFYFRKNEKLLDILKKREDGDSLLKMSLASSYPHLMHMFAGWWDQVEPGGAVPCLKWNIKFYCSRKDTLSFVKVELKRKIAILSGF